MADPYTQAIVADLPAPDELSPHQRKVVSGLALLKTGKTYREAAEAVGIGVATLWRHANGMNSEMERKEGFERLTADVETLSMAVLLKANENLLERLQTLAGMKPSEEIKAAQVARDTVAMRLGWDRSAPTDQRTLNMLADTLESMRDRARADAKVSEAIDVTGEAGE